MGMLFEKYLWVWPFSWYFRIRELEKALAEQRAMNCKLKQKLLEAHMEQFALTNVYTAAVASISAQIRHQYPQA